MDNPHLSEYETLVPQKKDIIHYNEEDCVSTGDLRNFLLDEKEKDDRYNDIPWFTPTISKKDEEKTKEVKRKTKPKSKKKTVQEVEEEESLLINKLNNSKKIKT